jgi:Rod binding domain-containing protein
VNIDSADIALSRTSAGHSKNLKVEDPKKVHEAAQQFESLMIGQMLKSIRENGDSWLGTGDDAAGSSALELAEEELAKSLSAAGGLGLARMVEAGLTHHAPHPKPVPAQKVSE